MRLFFAPLAGTLLMLATTSYAVACSCGFNSVEDQLQISDRVVSGTVESVEIIETEYSLIHRANVRVREVFKGVVDGRMLVDTVVFGSCSFALGVDDEYLIYASETSTEGVYLTSDCDRTRLRIAAEDDIVKLPDPIMVLQAQESTWSAVKSSYDESDER